MVQGLLFWGGAFLQVGIIYMVEAIKGVTMELWQLIEKYYKAVKKGEWYLETFVDFVERRAKEVVPDVECAYDEYKGKYVFKSESRKDLRTDYDLVDAIAECIPQDKFAKRVKNENIVVWLLIVELFDSEVKLTLEEYNRILQDLRTALVKLL